MLVNGFKRALLVTVGVVSLGLGALGIFLPLLPTTPFVLVSAFAFAKSSERLHQWLLAHDVFGPLIHNWQRHGAIGRGTKVVSLLSMVAILAMSALLSAPTHVIAIQAVVLSVSAVFIATRPLPPSQSSSRS